MRYSKYCHDIFCYHANIVMPALTKKSEARNADNGCCLYQAYIFTLSKKTALRLEFAILFLPNRNTYGMEIFKLLIGIYWGK